MIPKPPAVLALSLGLAAAVAVTVVALPACGQVPPGELQVGLGLTWGRAYLPAERSDGLGAEVHAALGLTRDLSLQVEAASVRHEEAEEGDWPGFPLSVAGLGVSYLLDDSEWRPYLGAGLAVYGGGPDTEDYTVGPLGVRLGVGLELPRFSFVVPGLWLGYHVFLPETSIYPHYLALSVRVAAAMQVW